MLRRALTTGLLLGLAACGPDYSPDTYATNAVQQANKVEQGVIVGVRDVAVSAAGTVGAVTGGAAGGIVGSQVGVGPVSAFTALGGTLVGGITGSAIEHASGDTKAFEYIVRKTSNDLVSVTQKDKASLALGQRVLVIAGNQARVVPDYTVSLTAADKAKVAEASLPDGGRSAPALAGTTGQASNSGSSDGVAGVGQVVEASGGAETTTQDKVVVSAPPDAPIQLAQPAIQVETPRQQ